MAVDPRSHGITQLGVCEPRTLAGVPEPTGGIIMETPHTARQTAPLLTRRQLLKAGLAAGATFSMRPLAWPPVLWGGESGQPKRGGILRVRGWDPPHFDPHLTIAPA